MTNQKWLEEVEIDPSIWQLNNRRWATPQHYTCSYMAMFPPALPHYFIMRFTEPGDIILDPFNGRGTTPLEAMAQNRVGIGNDLNDLAYLLTKGKLANPKLEDVLERLKELEKNYVRDEWLTFKGMPHKIRMIYHPDTQKQLMFLKQELNWRDEKIDSFISMILMGSMHGPSQGFLSISMPNTFSMSWNYVRKYINEKKLKRPKRDVFKIVEKRCRKTLREGKLPGKGIAIHGDVRDLRKSKHLKPNSIKMIFSSPPYLKVIKYGLYNWIRLWWLIGDYKIIDKKLDDNHDIHNYLDFMKEVLEETLPLMNKESGIACWVIGDVKEENLAKLVWNEVGSKIKIDEGDGNKLRYKLLGIIEDPIRNEEKVTRIWNSETNKSGKATPIDRIMIICRDTANPESFISNEEIRWNQKHT